MDKIRSWTEEDEAIIATNTDATECKRCAVDLGYWQDEYISLFARRAERKAPEISRGYYARVKGIEMFVHQFLERCDSKCQIINLGCGYDTLFWRLKDSTQAVGNFIELDFPSVTTKKCQIIKRNKKLLEKISNEDGEVVVSGRGAELHADGYHLAGCDLRAPGAVRRALRSCAWSGAAPTLLLAECVLAYLRPEPAAALLRALAEQHPRALLLLYEQCRLADRFGEVLVRNMAARGISVCGCSALGPALQPPAAHAARLLQLGWRRARAWDMTQVYRALPEADRDRVERLEMLDETELLLQLNQHYAIALASSCELFDDIDLAE